MEGNVVAFPLSSSPPYITSSTTNLLLTGSGLNEDRQLSSHPHQVIPHPTRDELFVPDLGDDKTLRLAKSAEGVWEIRGHLSYNAGSGPRHVAFYGTPRRSFVESALTTVRTRQETTSIRF